MSSVDSLVNLREGLDKDPPPPKPVLPSAAADVPPSMEPIIDLVSAATITPERIEWVWENFLAHRKMAILAGAPGTFKTTIAIAIVATITCGGRWPDGSRANPENVIIWSGEDSVTDTLVPRLILAGADLSRVKFISRTWEPERDGMRARAFDPAIDIPALAYQLEAERPALLLIDPIVSAVAGDSHKNAETRRGLQPLVDLAERCNTCILGISHFSKNTAGRDTTERVTGSLAFAALARVVLATAKLGDGTFALVRAKSNLGPTDGGFKFNFEVAELPSHPGISNTRILWREPMEGSAREILGEAEAEQDPEVHSAKREAMDFLVEELRDGELPQQVIISNAEKAGINEKTLRRAKKTMGISSRRRGAVWVWCPPQDAQQKNMSALSILSAMSALDGSEDGQDGQDAQGGQDFYSAKLVNLTCPRCSGEGCGYCESRSR